MPRPGSNSSTKERATRFARNYYKPWTDDEIKKIMADNKHDYELSKELGRSVNSIRTKRCMVNKEKKR